jgi:hypothetical protein
MKWQPPGRTVTLGAAIALLAVPALAQTSSGIPGVLAPGVEPELVQEGFVFTEGPVGTADGGLYFSDIRPTRSISSSRAARLR